MNQPTREEITQKLEKVLEGINIQDSCLFVHNLLWKEESLCSGSKSGVDRTGEKAYYEQ